MRTHKQIIQGFGARNIAQGLADKRVHAQLPTVQRWAERNSIPARYWQSIVDIGAATLDELAGDASVRVAA